MYETNARKIRFWYGIFLSALTLIVAFLFAAETADLYYSRLASGGDIYTRQVVGQRLSLLVIPVSLWFLTAVGAFVLSVLYPTAETRKKQGDAAALRRLKKRIPMGESAEFLAEKQRFDRYRLIRVLAWSVAALFTAASAILAIVYLARTSHFAAADVTAEILSLVKHVLPWVGGSFVLLVAATAADYLTVRPMLASAKKLVVLGKGAPLRMRAGAGKTERALEGLRSEKTLLVVRCVLLAAAVALILWGVFNGGATDVLIKAINICTECIGLG